MCLIWIYILTFSSATTCHVTKLDCRVTCCAVTKLTNVASTQFNMAYTTSSFSCWILDTIMVLIRQTCSTNFWSIYFLPMLGWKSGDSRNLKKNSYTIYKKKSKRLLMKALHRSIDDVKMLPCCTINLTTSNFHTFFMYLLLLNLK